MTSESSMSILSLTFSLAAVLWTMISCSRRFSGKMDRILAQMKETDNRIVMELHLLRAQLQNSPPEMLLKSYMPLLGQEPTDEVIGKKSGKIEQSIEDRLDEEKFKKKIKMREFRSRKRKKSAGADSVKVVVND
jgi:hypothetical protein